MLRSSFSRLFTKLLIVLPAAVLWAPDARPDAAPGAPEGFDRVVILATNSAFLEQNSAVASGDVVVNDSSPGPTLSSNRELTIGIGAATPAGWAVKADRIRVRSDAEVGGEVSCNDLDDATGTVTCQPLSLPVFPFLPPFVEAAPRPDAPDVFVAAGGSATLPPGDYGSIDVNQNGVVTFTGGVYNVREMDFGLSTELRFQAPSEVRVEGKLSIDQGSFAGPGAGSGIGAADVVFYVAGVNGATGNLGATPKAAKIGIGAEVHANFYVPNGTLWLRQNSHSTGAFIARDVDLGIGAQVTLASAFANRPPVAHPQTVLTAGPAAVDVLLTGSDPDGDSLTFSIVSPPEAGTLSAIDPVEPPPVLRCSVTGAACAVDGDCPEFPAESCEEEAGAVTSAVVTYTPDGGDDVEDAFTFQVADPAGGFGQAVVSINPPGDPTPPQVPVDTVIAHGGAATTSTGTPITLVLEADAPCDGLCDGEGADGDTPVAFTIVAGPGHGELGPVVPGEEVPQRRATVVYTPDAGFVSPPADAFTFEACGTIAGDEVCDQAEVTITVVEPQATADDQEVTTPVDEPVEITLTGSPGLPGGEPAEGGLRVVIGRAAFLDGSEIAGNVADADGNGFGDNHNALPGPVPGLMAAGVDLTGGAGSNGVVRMQIEWDISDLGGLAEDLVTAEVLLRTSKGTIDALDTFFFAGTEDQDGLLTDADFEAPAAAIPGVVMPVPPGPTGTEGTFSFDVKELLLTALSADRDFFSISGRVDEELAGSGPQRGLQVYTTASGNLDDFLHPQLALTTPGVTAPPLTFRIVSLPASGTLFDAFENEIVEVPAELPTDRVIYQPAVGFIGAVDFQFQVDDGLTTAVALVKVTIGTAFGFGDCEDSVKFCNDGRD